MGKGSLFNEDQKWKSFGIKIIVSGNERFGKKMEIST